MYGQQSAAANVQQRGGGRADERAIMRQRAAYLVERAEEKNRLDGLLQSLALNVGLGVNCLSTQSTCTQLARRVTGSHFNRKCLYSKRTFTHKIHLHVVYIYGLLTIGTDKYTKLQYNYMYIGTASLHYWHGVLLPVDSLIVVQNQFLPFFVGNDAFHQVVHVMAFCRCPGLLSGYTTLL